MHHVKAALRAIIKGYAEGKSLLDDGMLDHAAVIADHAEMLLKLIENHRPVAPVRSAPVPLKPVRMWAKDTLGNIYYLVVGPERIYLTNPGQVPLAMSNIFSDAARLEFTLADHRGERETLLRIVRAHPNSCGSRWELLP